MSHARQSSASPSDPPPGTVMRGSAGMSDSAGGFQRRPKPPQPQLGSGEAKASVQQEQRQQPQTAPEQTQAQHPTALPPNRRTGVEVEGALDHKPNEPLGASHPPEAADAEDEEVDDGSVYISAEDWNALQQLKADYDERGSRLEHAEGAIDQLKRELAKSQKSLEAMDQHVTDERARSYAQTEELRSDLAREVSLHSKTMAELATKVNEMQMIARERSTLQATLTHHERELASSAQTMQALRERIGVLVAIVQQREEDSKGEIQLVADGEAADSDAALDHLLQLPADASASTIIPALSSSTSGAPLQLRRSSLHSLLLHRSITQHKLQRLRVELSVEREQSARKEKEIEEQWKRLEEMREHLEQLEKEKAKVRSSEEEIGSERKDEEQVRESVAFASDASTSTLLLQLHTAETRVHRLEQANAAFMKRFCAHVLGWSLAVMVVSWIAMQG